MPYQFTCPHCQTKTQVEDRYSGQSGQCVTCGGEIQIPPFGAGTPASEVKTKSGGWIVAAAVCVILLGCLLFAMVRIGGQTMNQISTNRERSASMKNLERIAMALNNYAADNGTYPPPATTDRKGALLHSWRVLILPYLDQDDLFNRFDLDLAWHHPTNMEAARDMPQVFRHPNGGVNSSYNESGYYLIKGMGTLFPKAGPLGPDQITDDPSQTILVIEGSPLVPSGMWTEPLDLDFANMQGMLGTKPGIEPGGLLDDGVAFSTADGRGHFVPNTMEPIKFRSLVTSRGGERLPDDTLD
jgi:hypothetical protein